MENLRKHVEALVERAAKDKSPDHAMKFAQAALNAANVMATLRTIEQSH